MLAVNAMQPHAGRSLANDPFVIVPEHGAWCHDHAVTKQWLLAAFGIVSKLCECVGPVGEHHMVLLVQNKLDEAERARHSLLHGGDFNADILHTRRCRAASDGE
jgi:hypothetical protein